MSIEQIEIAKEIKEARKLSIQNSKKSQLVSDFFFDQAQRLRYPYALSYQNPISYVDFLQTESSLVAQNNEYQKASLHLKLRKLTDENHTNRIINRLTDDEILILNTNYDAFLLGYN